MSTGDSYTRERLVKILNKREDLVKEVVAAGFSLGLDKEEQAELRRYGHHEDILKALCGERPEAEATPPKPATTPPSKPLRPR